MGLPTCFVLGIIATIARRILPTRRREISGKAPIAVVKFFGIGSIIEATPLLRAIRKTYPDATLIFVTFEVNRRLLETMDLCIELRTIRTSSPWKFAWDVLRTLVWLRRRKIEAVVDLEFFSKFSTLLSFASRAPIRIGYHLNDFWRYSLVTHPIYFNYFRHLTDVFFDAGSQMGVTVEDRNLPKISTSEQVQESVRESLQEHGWSDGTTLLGVNVNAGELSYERRWPIDRFATVIEKLLTEMEDLHVVLTGAPAERTYTRSLLDHLPDRFHDRVFVAAGEWSLEELLGGMLLFDGFLTNDSGPMHLAAVQKVPIVSLWGPTRPAFFAPKTNDMVVLWEDYTCSPCVGMFTTFEGMWCDHDGRCMLEIEPETVSAAVASMLAKARSGKPSSTSEQ